MLIRQGASRDARVDRRLACSLAAIAGGLNAAAFHAAGFFSANMTGNVSLIASNIAFRDAAAAFFLGILLAFIGGSALSTLLINAGRRRGLKGVYALVILAESVLLALLGAALLWLRPSHPAPLLILGLSFLMGLQNAVVTRISEARVRSTHISGVSTDIGIELGMLIDIAAGREAAAEAAMLRGRLLLHGLTVLSFLGGGIAGVLAYRAAGNLLLLGIAALLLGMALNGLLRLRTLPAAAPAGGAGA